QVGETASAVRDQALALIPADPRAALASAGRMAVNAVEAFGVIKGAGEAWSWVLSRVRRKVGASRDTAIIADETGMQPAAVTNITINVAVSGQSGAEEAAARIAREVARSTEAGSPDCGCARAADRQIADAALAVRDGLARLGHGSRGDTP